MKNRFYRGERLKSRKEIQGLFGRQSMSLSSYPLRLIYTEMEEKRGNYPLQVAFSVPKRRYKQAVRRNRIKRLMRESFRLNKQLILNKLPTDAPQYAWMILYVGKEEMSYHYIDRKMRKLMLQFSSRLTKDDQL
ncbi:MAG: ribonuclease P protein component [Bacteroidota bacterium]